MQVQIGGPCATDSRCVHMLGCGVIGPRVSDSDAGTGIRCSFFYSSLILPPTLRVSCERA